MSPRSILDDVLAEHSASWSEDDRALMARVIQRAAIAGGAGAIYGDLGYAAELAQIRAQIANLSAAAAQNAATIARNAIERLLAGAAALAIKGLGVGA